MPWALGVSIEWRIDRVPWKMISCTVDLHRSREEKSAEIVCIPGGTGLALCRQDCPTQDSFPLRTTIWNCHDDRPALPFDVWPAATVRSESMVLSGVPAEAELMKPISSLAAEVVSTPEAFPMNLASS